MIDDEEFAGAFRRFKFQSELFLNGGKEARSVGVAVARSASALAGTGDLITKRVITHCKLQMEIKLPREAGLVDNQAAGVGNSPEGEHFAELIERKAVCIYYERGSVP